MKTTALLLILLAASLLTTTVRAQTDEVIIRKTPDAIWPAFEKHDLPTFASELYEAAKLIVVK